MVPTTSHDSQPTPSSDSNTPTESQNVGAPAFLDLADSAARLSSNLPDINMRIELKRLEHERQRTLQRKMFEEQMRLLEQQQAIEERELLSLPTSDNTHQHIALSAPTTPPRVNGEPLPVPAPVNSVHFTQPIIINGNYTSEAKSTAASPVTQSGYGSHTHAAGAKSMPASRRGSSGSKDGDDLVLHVQNMALHDKPLSANPAVTRPIGSGLRQHSAGLAGFNPDFLFDEDLDNEIQYSLRNLPSNSEDEKFFPSRPERYARKLSVSSAALDLAPLSQTPPRSFGIRSVTEGGGLKSSEWPQFSGPPHPSTFDNKAIGRRVITNPGAIGTPSIKTGVTSVSASSTPHHPRQLSPDVSRRPTPPGISSTESSIMSSSATNTPSLTSNGTSAIIAARSVPATPLSTLNPSSILHSGLNTKPLSEIKSAVDRSYTHTPELGNTFQRVGSGAYDNQITFGSVQTVDDTLQPYGIDYGVPAQTHDVTRFPNYNGGGYESRSPSAGSHNGMPGGANSGAIYQNNGGRYGLGVGQGNGRFIANGPDSKMNGLHGPKHKRGDMDREFNRFAGTRLEDLQGEIPSLCKDQHGCRYLQKKLEEGVPEHRDMIFRETFGHFADLMTDPFGNYLCQKLLEYSTDEQRNVICDAVAADLVAISLNMHGTRAVQKMIDFLSSSRQIHSIIVALSLHVVTLIKDLNGNHVVQKCLNRLSAEDNQFIYNAVAAHCVEVATHRHGCCVLQRCVDHASDSQRVQLVTEITYNALTLVQDPYGNYVVQYILDLNDNRFSDAVIRQFVGNVCALSVQKFSSNVIEKCIRVAEHNTRKLLIEELLNRSRLEKLLRDSFGNYCVQTALDYAEPNQRMMLVEGIRPILPLIRNTPYGKRIQSKLQREQMEANNAHYGAGFHHGQHAALVNLALSGNGGPARHHMSPSMHPATHLSDPYSRTGHYSPATPQMHAVQQLHGLQQHDHAYATHPLLQGAGNQTSLSGVSGFQNTYANGFGGSIGLTSAANDPYQRVAFPYTM